MNHIREIKSESETLPPISIGFGYEFIKAGGNRRMVITNTRTEGLVFEANYVKKVGQKEILNPQAGTCGREDIAKMTGEVWDLGRVKRGVMNYLDDPEAKADLYDLYDSYSRQPSRMLSM